MKHFLPVLCIFLTPFILYSQYSIDFENMDLGPVSSQSMHIKLWDNTSTTDPNITDVQSFSGSKSLLISGNQTDDVLFKLGDKDSGTWIVQFKVYIPSGHSGYYNIQEYEKEGEGWNGNYYMGVFNDEVIPEKFIYSFNSDSILHETSFPYNKWFTVKMMLHLNDSNPDSSTISTWVNNSLFMDEFPYISTFGSPENNLGSINFFSVHPSMEMYIDDFVYGEGTVSTTELSLQQNLEVYPNPVSSQLKVQEVEAVEVIKLYNTQGHKVLHLHPGIPNPSLNIDQCSSGVYYVHVITASGTVKVSKIVIR